MSSRIAVLPDALHQIEEAAAWWREHRPAAPELLARELSTAFARLESQPDAGRPLPRPRFPKLRILLLPRSRYHVYYEHDAAHELVLVRAFWGAVRGQRPPLRRR